MRTHLSLFASVALTLFVTLGGGETVHHSLLISKASGTPPIGDAARLDGGFIQYNNAVTKLKSSQWQTLMRQMYEEAKMDTVIIQRLGFRDGNEKYVLSTPSIDPENPAYIPAMKLSIDDPTLSILTYADSTQKSSRPMKVFIGLWMEDKEQWSYDVPYGRSPEELKQYLGKVSDKNTKWADLAWNLYHKHPSFRGWYLPHEYWNFPYGDPGQESVRSEKQNILRDFLHVVSGRCKALNDIDKKAGNVVDRPVAFSPFFNPWQDANYAGSKVTEETFTSILQDSGIDILMLQDGSGARCLDNEALNEKANLKRPEVKRQIVPEFFNAFAAACRANNVRLWADLEIYKTGPKGCEDDQPIAWVPFQISTTDQLRWQFTIANRNPLTNKLYDPPLFDRYIAFDIFHYLNAVIPDNFGANRPKAERTVFFNDYKRVFVENEFKP